MSAVLNIINNFDVESGGITYSGKQGADDLAVTDPLEVTVLGNVFAVRGTLATGDAVEVWAAADDDPTTFDYAYFKADEDIYVQLITAGGQAVMLVPADMPQTFTRSTLLVNASTTALDGSATPTLVAIAKVVLCNRSGNSAKYLFECVK